MPQVLYRHLPLPAKLDLSPNALTPMLEKTSIFQKAIEAVVTLDPEAQAILVDIIQKRLKQQRRDDLLKEIVQAERDYAQVMTFTKFTIIFN
ncbi:MAG: hypothetical protein V7K21_24010 [Nostoc sp.]|uniref:hypothetical protein n=1 Tax=Nostoc sp. TaxID=1180 RepID=UPI002FF9A8D5